jgi:hypothetical protein
MNILLADRRPPARFGMTAKTVQLRFRCHSAEALPAGWVTAAAVGVRIWNTFITSSETPFWAPSAHFLTNVTNGDGSNSSAGRG